MRHFIRASIAVAAIGFLVGIIHADSRPQSPAADLKRLPKDAARLHAETLIFPQPTRWLEIPWLLDLNEGIRLAKKEHRPVLIWVSGDDPLERC